MPKLRVAKIVIAPDGRVFRQVRGAIYKVVPGVVAFEKKAVKSVEPTPVK